MNELHKLINFLFDEHAARPCEGACWCDWFLYSHVLSSADILYMIKHTEFIITNVLSDASINDTLVKDFVAIVASERLTLKFFK